MEDLITILIIVIGVGVKIYSALKKNKPVEEDKNNAPSWDEFLDSVEKTPELREYVENDPELKYALNEAEKSRRAQQQALAQAQAERDAAMLEAQQRYAEMAEAAARQNQERGDYVMAENPEEEPGETMDWAALIRCNAAEAVVISEILAKPPALR